MINLWPPALIIYKPDLGLRNGKVIYGTTRGPVVWIREDTKEDKGVLAHELEHVRQFWCYGLLIHMVLLNFPSYRAWTEVKAMEKQEK